MPKRPRFTTALVSWKQVANAKGYRVMWGTVSRQYSYVQDVAASLNYRVPNLKRGVPYFFAAKAYSTTQTSPFSNEVRYVP